MRDLAFVAFIAGLLALGLKRPFLFVLAYIYVDTVSPQRLSYFLLNSIPLSLIIALLAMGGWALTDRKDGTGFSVRQGLLLVLLAYAGMTTLYADFPVDAAEKWDPAWKTIVFAVFLPFTLRTKLRIEAVLLFLTLSAASIVIVGGIKTALGGGGYGVLNLMVDNNSGLYESSTISTVAIALIPIILWLSRFGTIFPPDWRVKTFAGALIFACLLMPIGTEARTGLVCIALLGVLMLRDTKRRFLYIAGAGLLGVAAIPFLPSSFTSRMDTIQGFQADQSAGTRLAVWAWTWDYAQHHPFGGGFGAYRSNHIQVQMTNTQSAGEVQVVTTQTEADEARAYHSAYFEMLGEQGFPGLAMFLLINAIGLVRMEMIRRRYRKREGEEAWIAPLATALQHFQLVYMTGEAFVGIAYQSFGWLVFATAIGFDAWLVRREKAARKAGAPFASKLAAGPSLLAN
ncbi:MAG: putative O-glycosylation ligase, exosortase A system-associated [Sphingomonadaceae bacterium]|nr:putative O-glycosylation ligase, exosortase A system-associated [Sphingomonadaceae bacterium]